MLFCLFVLLGTAECTHIFTLDEDFSKLKTDPALAKNAIVDQVLKRLHTFKVSVHPRIPLLYRLLQRSMASYAHRVSDSLYTPHVYQQENYV